MNEYAVTGSSFPMHISGKEFAAFSLRDKDYTELDGYIQSKVIEVAANSVNLVALDQEERMEWQQSAIKAAASTGWGTPEGNKIMNTNEGLIRLGWQMIRKENKITFESFMRLAYPEGDSGALVRNLAEIGKCYAILNLIDSEEDNDDNDDNDDGADQEDAPVTSKSGDEKKDV